MAIYHKSDADVLDGKAMKHSKHLVTSCEALRRVFFAPLYLQSLATQASHKHANPKVGQSLSPTTYSSYQPQHRHYASFANRSTQIESDSNDFGPRSNHPRRDEEIKAWKIHVVQADGKLSEPEFLTDVLDRRQRDEKGRPTQFIQEVAGVTKDRPFTICKIYDKKMFRDQELVKKKAKKVLKHENKQLDLNWAVSENDLGHRLAKMKEFLEKGWRVEIVFGSKRKSGWMKKRQVSEDEAEALLGKIRAAVKEVEGAKERTEMQGLIGGEAVLSFEGSRKK